MAAPLEDALTNLLRVLHPEVDVAESPDADYLRIARGVSVTVVGAAIQPTLDLLRNRGGQANAAPAVAGEAMGAAWPLQARGEAAVQPGNQPPRRRRRLRRLAQAAPAAAWGAPVAPPVYQAARGARRGRRGRGGRGGRAGRQGN